MIVCIKHTDTKQVWRDLRKNTKRSKAMENAVYEVELPRVSSLLVLRSHIPFLRVEPGSARLWHENLPRDKLRKNREAFPCHPTMEP